MKHSRTAPVPDRLTGPFWQATGEGRLLVQRSPRSGRYQWYPRSFCLDDPTMEPTWVESSGRGIVHTYSVVERTGNPAIEPPFVVAVVELEEGVWMTANIVDVPPEEVHVDMPVSVVFEDLADGLKLPQFTRRDPGE